ncbi:MAG: two-component regulator propeller domain-containing protein, partial [Bacteroidota bacterium]
MEGLSGINPTTLYYSEENDLFFIGYQDGMINAFTDPDQLIYLDDIQRNEGFTGKSINDFVSDGNRLYVATEFGLVVYDIDTRLPLTDVSRIGDNPTKLPVLSVSISDGFIWLVLDDRGLYKAPINAPNLKDPATWLPEAGVDGLPDLAPIFEVEANTANLYALSDNVVYRKEAGQWETVPELDGIWDRIYITDEAIGASRINRSQINYIGSLKYNVFVTGSVSHVAIQPNLGRFFIATRFEGMYSFDKWDINNITPDGPTQNTAIRLAAGNGELYVAPGGYDQALVPVQSAAGVFYYNRENGWNTLDSASQQLPESVSTGFARVEYDTETGTAYAASFGSGLVELKEGVVQNFYNCENAGLPTINTICNLNNRANSRVSGVARDLNGNLWVSLTLATSPLVVQTTDGEWIAMPGNRFPSNHEITDVVVDEFGNKWMLNEEKGLVVYNDQGTPRNFDDDIVLTLRSGLNQGNLPTNEVKSIAVDNDGFIWVGTNQGVTVFFDPGRISQGIIVDASPPVFERRPLLKDAIINDIAVDGGNRKWFATNEGVFLVTEDGDDVIFQFTVDNSPLLS